jgi:hypothetical protein
MELHSFISQKTIILIGVSKIKTPTAGNHHTIQIIRKLFQVCVSTPVHASNTDTLHLANKYAHFYPDSHNTHSNQRYLCMHIVRKSSLNISCILCLYYSHYKHVNMEEMITATYFVEIYVLKLFSVLYVWKCFVNHENKWLSLTVYFLWLWYPTQTAATYQCTTEQYYQVFINSYRHLIMKLS